MAAPPAVILIPGVIFCHARHLPDQRRSRLTDW